MAKAAAAGGADAISLINTCLGMAIDWRRRRPMLGNVVGGLSGPAIKPIALRAVFQAANAVETPIIGIGGIATIDDVMEFVVAGASAVQLGTVNFYNPRASMEVLTPAGGAGCGHDLHRGHRRYLARKTKAAERVLGAEWTARPPSASHPQIHASSPASTDRSDPLGQLLRAIRQYIAAGQ
jgi:dihydroorotate dehydrogenase (NAD+) catalytic subunit